MFVNLLVRGDYVKDLMSILFSGGFLSLDNLNKLVYQIFIFKIKIQLKQLASLHIY